RPGGLAGLKRPPWPSPSSRARVLVPLLATTRPGTPPPGAGRAATATGAPRDTSRAVPLASATSYRPVPAAKASWVAHGAAPEFFRTRPRPAYASLTTTSGRPVPSRSTRARPEGLGPTGI